MSVMQRIGWCTLQVNQCVARTKKRKQFRKRQHAKVWKDMCMDIANWHMSRSCGQARQGA